MKRTCGKAGLLVAGMVICGGQASAPSTAPAAGAPAAPAAATAPAALTARATVLEWTNRVPISERDANSWFGDRNAFFMRSRDGAVSLSIVAELSAPAAKVAEDVAITAVTDDLGTDLLRGAQARLGRSRGMSESALSSDKKHVLFDVAITERPPAAARELTIKGKLSVTDDGTPQVVTAEKVPLEIGKEIIAGDVTLHIFSLALDERGGTRIGMLVKSSHALKGIEFIGEDGRKLSQSPDFRNQDYESMNGRGFENENTERPIYFAVGRDIKDAVTMKISLSKDTKTTYVPFEVKTRVGL